MNFDTVSRENNELVRYLNESFRMIYYNEQNEKKILWWWLNKFEYLAYLTEVPDDKMAELFIDMVDENIHERVKEKYPAINFTELSYEEIIGHYICYFDYSDEILSHRKPFQHRNNYEAEAIQNYADNLQDTYNNSIYRYYLEKKIARQYFSKFNEIEVTKYLIKCPTLSLHYTLGIVFAKMIEVARYINPAYSTIQIYKSTNTGKFHEWLDKFEYVANINKVPNDRMFEFFNNMIDNDVHSAVKMTYPSISLSELKYEEVINFYLQYFASSDDSDLHKTRLLGRKQYKQETIENYANSLRKLFGKCSYTSKQNKILSQQFLNGIYDNEISRILNKFPNLSFDEMIPFAIELTKVKKISILLQSLTTLQTFHPMNGEEFYVWLNKFEYIASTIGIPNDEIVPFFKEMVHNDVHARVQECNPRVNFSEISYEEIEKHYLRSLCLSTESYLHRKRFFCRKQYEQETIESYAYFLRKIYNKCYYRDRLGEKLRKYFRTGIYDYKIKTYIGKYPDLSYEIMVAIAIAHSNELIFMENE